jgi:hypothetical protein
MTTLSTNNNVHSSFMMKPNKHPLPVDMPLQRRREDVMLNEPAMVELKQVTRHPNRSDQKSVTRQISLEKPQSLRKTLQSTPLSSADVKDSSMLSTAGLSSDTSDSLFHFHVQSHISPDTQELETPSIQRSRRSSSTQRKRTKSVKGYLAKSMDGKEYLADTNIVQTRRITRSMRKMP